MGNVNGFEQAATGLESLARRFESIRLEPDVKRAAAMLSFVSADAIRLLEREGIVSLPKPPPGLSYKVQVLHRFWLQYILTLERQYRDELPLNACGLNSRKPFVDGDTQGEDVDFSDPHIASWSQAEFCRWLADKCRQDGRQQPAPTTEPAKPAVRKSAATRKPDERKRKLIADAIRAGITHCKGIRAYVKEKLQTDQDVSYAMISEVRKSLDR